VEVVSRTHLFHYALHSASHLDAIVREGLRPLSDFPESERWRAIEAEVPGFFESVYARVAEPVLGTPYERSGVFLTPIDFRLLPGSLLEERVRLRIPLERIEGTRAVVTWHAEGDRVSLPFDAEALGRAAEEWPARRVTSWFGRDPTRLFFHVPQVATYQPRVAVEPDDVEPPA
jgi:hypothetical protein